MIREFINTFGRVTYRVKRFSQLVREDFKEVFFSERQNDIDEWTNKARALGYEILKLIEFYESSSSDFKHWIDSAAEKLTTKGPNQFITPISILYFLEDIDQIEVGLDIKKEIKNSLHGERLLEDIWVKDIIKEPKGRYIPLLKINNNKRIYDNDFYNQFFMNLYLVLKNPSELHNIDTNTLYKKKKIKITVEENPKRPKPRSKHEIKKILREYIIKIMGYEN